MPRPPITNDHAMLTCLTTSRHNALGGLSSLTLLSLRRVELNVTGIGGDDGVHLLICVSASSSPHLVRLGGRNNGLRRAAMGACRGHGSINITRALRIFGSIFGGDRCETRDCNLVC